MAQNTYINVALSAAAAAIFDPKGNQHTASGGAAAANDLTVSYDNAKVTTLAVFDSGVATARRRAIAGGLK